jgi:hypothetical protein
VLYASKLNYSPRHPIPLKEIASVVEGYKITSTVRPTLDSSKHLRVSLDFFKALQLVYNKKEGGSALQQAGYC